MAYSQEVKQFLHSKAWTEYVYPMIMQVVQAELPDPSQPHWELKYQKMFALSTAFQLIMSALTTGASRKDFLEKNAKFSEKVYDGTPVA